MEHDDDVAPAGPAFSREEHAAIGDRVNRIAQIAVLAADAVEIVAEMAILGKRLRVVGERAVLASDREIEPRRGGQRGQKERRRKLKGRIDPARAGAVPARDERRGPRPGRAETGRRAAASSPAMFFPCSQLASSLRSRDANFGHGRCGIYRLAPCREIARDRPRSLDSRRFQRFLRPANQAREYRRPWRPMSRFIRWICATARR